MRERTYQIRCCQCGKVFGLTDKRHKAGIICLKCLMQDEA